MKRKPYDYVQAVASSAVIDADAERYIKRVLRRLVREAVIAAYAYDGAVHVQEARAHQIALKLVP